MTVLNESEKLDREKVNIVSEETIVSELSTIKITELDKVAENDVTMAYLDD